MPIQNHWQLWAQATKLQHEDKHIKNHNTIGTDIIQLTNINIGDQGDDGLEGAHGRKGGRGVVGEVGDRGERGM